MSTYQVRICLLRFRVKPWMWSVNEQHPTLVRPLRWWDTTNRKTKQVLNCYKYTADKAWRRRHDTMTAVFFSAHWCMHRGAVASASVEWVRRKKKTLHKQSIFVINWAKNADLTVCLSPQLTESTTCTPVRGWAASQVLYDSKQVTANIPWPGFYKVQTQHSHISRLRKQLLIHRNVKLYLTEAL